MVMDGFQQDKAGAQPVNDGNLAAAMTRARGPVLLFFTQPRDEVCEFNRLVVDQFARERADDVTVLRMDKEESPVTAGLFSVPEGSVVMMIRQDAILGYRQGKLSPRSLAAWAEESLARPDADGVKLEEFLRTIDKKQERQRQDGQAAIQRARLRSLAGAAVRIAGGAVIASSFPVGGFGALGLVVAAHSAFKAHQVLRTPGVKPQDAQGRIGKLVGAAVNVAGCAGGFGLLGLAYGTMAGVAFYATMAAAVTMMAHGSMGLGRLLPPGLLIGSLKRDMEEIARRDPTKPLDEYSPPAPQPEFEVTPAIKASLSAKTDFGAPEKGAAVTDRKPAARGPQP